MKQLQYGFSTTYAAAAYAREGRERKARKVLSILEDAAGGLAGKNLLDIGCSAGIMTRCFASAFGQVVGTDIDLPALAAASSADAERQVLWAAADSQRLPFGDGAFDVVNCTHIYEHVPDAASLMAEIFRVLRPGGICFFSAGNRLSYMEPHYRLPLLSVVPKFVAHRYLRLLGRGSHYYETHLTYWGLRRLVSRFALDDYTVRVVADPQRYFADDMVKPGSLKQRVVFFVLRYAMWVCPTYLWVLRKPGPAT
jgi:2-polyprenyl-3-methyl-5-hydroxy-6-metoxy-1,4-benzoquinol methylase